MRKMLLYLMFPLWFVWYISGTLNPLFFSISTDNQRVIYSIVNLDKMNNNSSLMNC